MKNFPTRFDDLFRCAVIALGYEEAFEITELILRIYETSIDYEITRSSEAVKEE